MGGPRIRENERLPSEFVRGAYAMRATFNGAVYAIRSRLKLFSDFTYFLNDPLNADQFEQSERRRVLGGEASERWNVTWAGIDMSHTLGVQGRRDHLDPVALYRTSARQRIGTTREDRVTQSSGAVHYENRACWTSWLRSIAGARFDACRFNVASGTPLGPRGERHRILLRVVPALVAREWRAGHPFPSG